MLQTLKVHNFKTFLNTELQFSRQHLLIGNNTSGKTNLATALQFLAATASLELTRAAELVPGGIAELCNWSTKTDQVEISCQCRLEFEGEPCDYAYALCLARQLPKVSAPGSEVQVRVVSEHLSFNGTGFDNVMLLENDGREAAMLHEEQARSGQQPHKAKTLAPKNATMLSKLFDLETNRRAILFREYLSRWQYYTISPLAIRRGPFESQAPRYLWLDSMGGQLSNALFHLKNVDERRYRRVIEHANIVEPALRAVNFVVVPDNTPIPFVELEGNARASWPGLSDGTLRALALSVIIELASALSPPDSRTPALAIVEEPENGIFPGQLRRFFDMFEEWAPSAQFIFTSHSPYFIDMFDDKRDSVTILTRERDRTGIARTRPPEPLDSEDRLTLSMEYASELFQ